VNKQSQAAVITTAARPIHLRKTNTLGFVVMEKKEYLSKPATNNADKNEH
jgi:hypothetical protein